MIKLFAVSSDCSVAQIVVCSAVLLGLGGRRFQCILGLTIHLDSLCQVYIGPACLEGSLGYEGLVLATGGSLVQAWLL